MAETTNVICRADALVDGGPAVRFKLALSFGSERELPCFAIAYDGDVYGYINSCPHRGTELDWQEGEVFEETGLYLMCATHGALFEPDSGLCVGGPCQGAHLRSVTIKVVGSDVVLLEGNAVIGNEKREP